MQQHNLTTFTELESFYISKLINITRRLNAKNIVWQEVFDNNVYLSTDDAVIHVWKNDYYEHELERVSVITD